MNLMEGLLNEIDRCKEILGYYEEVPAGAFGAMNIRKDIEVAKKAVAEDDIIQMVTSLKILKEIK